MYHLNKKACVTYYIDLEIKEAFNEDTRIAYVKSKLIEYWIRRYLAGDKNFHIDSARYMFADEQKLSILKDNLKKSRGDNSPRHVTDYTFHDKKSESK